MCVHSPPEGRLGSSTLDDDVEAAPTSHAASCGHKSTSWSPWACGLSFIRNYKPVFPRGRTGWFPPAVNESSGFSVPWAPAVGFGCSHRRWWCLIVILMCISWMTSHVNHLIMWLFAIFFGEVAVKVLGPWLHKVICFLIIEF